jgi:hypothetical protein
MILTLDNLGKRYGMLPSQVIAEATTFDLVVMDAAISFQNHSSRDPNDASEEELLKILEKSRGN